MRVFVCLLVLHVLCVAVIAQEPSVVLPPAGDDFAKPPRTAEALTAGAPDFIALLDADLPSSYDWLQATVSVEDKAAGVSWAPFLPMQKYNEFFSETRFQVGQKDGKTNLGITLRWNPVSPRSDLGIREWGKQKIAAFGNEYAVLRDLRNEAMRFQDEVLAIEQPEISRLRTRVIELTRLKQAHDLDDTIDPQVKAAVVADLEKTAKELAALREEARIARRKRITSEIKTKRAELTAAATADARKAVLRAEIEALLESASVGAGDLASIDADIGAIEKSMGKKFASTIAAYELALYGKPIPIISLTYSGSLFPGIGGSFVDADADGLDDSAHVLAGRSLLLSGQMRFGPEQQVTFGVGRSWKWASAEQGTPTNKSDNYALSYARRLKVLDPEYQKSEEYLSSLFVPSIVGGMSAEFSDCRTETANCQDKAESIFAVTPFVDVKLKKAAQFRIGVTWKQFNGSAIADEEVGVVTLISLQLGLPN